MTYSIPTLRIVPTRLQATVPAPSVSAVQPMKKLREMAVPTLSATHCVTEPYLQSTTVTATCRPMPTTLSAGPASELDSLAPASASLPGPSSAPSSPAAPSSDAASPAISLAGLASSPTSGAISSTAETDSDD